MQGFAVIMLVILMVLATHFHNWVVRMAVYDHDDGGIVTLIIVTALYLIGMYFGIKYVIIWGYPIIH
jgi:hypothetical protein